MSQATINSGNVEFGPCQVTFGGVELGAFKGGVTTRYSYTLTKSKPDQLSTPNTAFITGEEFVVRVPILETTLTNLQYVIPTGNYETSGTKKHIEVGGDQLASADFKQLILTPLTDLSGTLSTDENLKCTVHRALQEGPIEKSYNSEGERVVTLEFHAYSDTTKPANNQLFTWGDTSF